MKINLSEEHRDKILSYIKEYKTINEEYSKYIKDIQSLQEQINVLKEKLQSTESNLQFIRDEEKKYMVELHDIYGNFTLNDLLDSIS